MFTIHRKLNWDLNPNDKVVNGIIKGLERNSGYCPCNQGDTPKEYTKCPCKSYIENDKCCCSLYVKKYE